RRRNAGCAQRSSGRALARLWHLAHRNAGYPPPNLGSDPGSDGILINLHIWMHSCVPRTVRCWYWVDFHVFRWRPADGTFGKSQAIMGVSAHVVEVRRQPLVGISLKLASVCSFMVMNSFIKAVDDVPAGQITFFRSLFAMVPIIVLLTYQGELRTAFRTSRPFSHFVRGSVGVASMMMTFFAITHLP